MGVTILDCRLPICDCAAQSTIANPKSKIDLRSRRGTVELMSTILAVPVFVIAIGLLLYYGRALYVQAALEDAAGVGARWAPASLSGEQGCQQAREALTLTLGGYYIDASRVRFSIRPLAAWARDARAEVRLSYRVDQSAVPVFGALLGDITAGARLSVPIDTFNNRYAWSECH